MKMNSINKILTVFILFTAMISCKKNEGKYYNYNNEKVRPYNGTVLQYLESLPSRYDSMMVVINRVPGLRDSLVQSGISVFAVQNDSFSKIINELNRERKYKGLAPVFLNDMDESELDTMICRYVFKKELSTELLAKNSNGLFLNSIKFNYQMHCQYQLSDASGLVGSGVQRIAFSDTHNSILSKNWGTALTSSELNIKASNGFIHELVEGHNFGFDDFIRRLNK